MRWEYKLLRYQVKHLDIPSEEIGERLDELGAEGWELVSMFPFSTTQGQISGIVVALKRQLS